MIVNRSAPQKITTKQRLTRKGFKISARKEYQEQNRIRRGYEKSLRKKFNSFFSKTGKRISKQYAETGQIPQIDGINQGVNQILVPHYRSVLEKFATRFIENNQQKQDDAFNWLVHDYLNKVGGEQIVRISNSTRGQINKVVMSGQAEGLGQEVIARNINKSMESPFAKYRARTIARTETHNAANFANQAIAEEMQIPNMVKQWVASNDDRSRTWHVEVSGKQVGMEEDFIVGGVPMKYPSDQRGGAANVINCRCIVLYVTPEDEVIERDSPTNYGDTNEEVNELNIHRQTFGKNTPKKILNLIKMNIPVANILFDKAKAFHQGTGRSRGTISVHNRKQTSRSRKPVKGTPDAGIWRHEYGHHMDTWLAKKQLQDEGENVAQFISATKADDILKDKNSWDKKRQKDAEEAYNKDIEDWEKRNQAELDRKMDSDDMENWEIDDLVLEAAEDAGLTADDLDVMFSTYGWRHKDLHGKTATFNYKGKKGTQRITETFGRLKESRSIDGKTIYIKEKSVIQFQKSIVRTMYALKNGHLSKKAVDDILKYTLLGRKGGRNYSISLDKEYTSSLFMDYLDAVSNSQIGWGHGTAYYRKRRRLRSADGTTINDLGQGNATEAFANYIAIMGADPKTRKLYRKLMEKFAPETTQAFDDIVDKLNSGYYEKLSANRNREFVSLLHQTSSY
jgi:hypothetical protein